MTEAFSGYPEMVRIAPGRFMMGELLGYGQKDEHPQHEVRIEYVFELGKYPVTFAEWDAALAAGANLHKPDDRGWGRDRRPVIYVSWHDAQEYIAFLNDKRGLSGRPDRYRLPSEAEWEYACRAGTTTPYSWGSYESLSTSKAQFDRNKSATVGSFPPNAFGLYDMHGNVDEWCEDEYHENYRGAPADGSAWTGDVHRRSDIYPYRVMPSQRVLRGGSYCLEGELTSRYLRSPSRSSQDPTIRQGDCGFRVAITL